MLTNLKNYLGNKQIKLNGKKKKKKEKKLKWKMKNKKLSETSQALYILQL